MGQTGSSCKQKVTSSVGVAAEHEPYIHRINIFKVELYGSLCLIVREFERIVRVDLAAMIGGRRERVCKPWMVLWQGRSPVGNDNLRMVAQRERGILPHLKLFNNRAVKGAVDIVESEAKARKDDGLAGDCIMKCHAERGR